MRTLLLAPLLLLTGLLAAQTWEPLGAGTGSAVYTLEPFGDGLFAGGTFTQAGGLDAHYLARWDGAAWSTIGSLGNFLASDVLYATDTALIVGTLGRVRWWNGSTWGVLPGTFNSDIYAVRHFRDTLYTAGFYSRLNGVPYPHVARWNGTAWDSLTSGCNAQVTDLEPYQGKLFVGGDFQLAGDTLCQHVAWWDGAAWSRMGHGVNDGVYTHCIYRDTLYIGGSFTQANGLPASHVAKWNGSEFVAVGGPLNDLVVAMAVYRDQLYIGGMFTTPSHIARLQGHAWVPVGTGCDDDVRVLDVFQDALYAGGSFMHAGDVSAAHIARWTLPPPPVAAFSTSDTALCAGGCTTFTDLSGNAPTAWAWSFPGGTPATSTAASPTVCYAAPGSYDAYLQVSNAGGSSAALGASVITVEVCTGLSDAGHTPRPRFVPEVFTDRLQLVGGNGCITTLAVFSAQGARVPVDGTAGALDTARWASGTYLLVATLRDGTMLRQRVVKAAY